MSKKLSKKELKEIEEIRETLAASYRAEIFAEDAALLLRAYDRMVVERNRIESSAISIEETTLEMIETHKGEIRALENEIASLKAALAASSQSGLKDMRGGHVEVVIRSDGKVLWVNSDDGCVLRICEIEHLDLQDSRFSLKESEGKSGITLW